MLNIQVFHIGSTVCIGDGIRAKVISIRIGEHHHVQYEVAWWFERERHTAWVEQVEIEQTDEVKVLEIGFLSSAISHTDALFNRSNIR